MSGPYLDAAPMIRALQDCPSDFERLHNCVRHRPSRHWLAFDADGEARIFARCSCAELPIDREQSAELRAAVNQWEEAYWRPLVAREAADRRVAEINREFARHFGPKTWWRRASDTIAAWFGVGAVGTGFRIDPSLPEDRELLAAVPIRARMNSGSDGCARIERADA